MTQVKRLFKTFQPKHYNLSIDIDDQDDTFKGLVTIEGNAPGNEFYLHAKDLSIKTININGRRSEWNLEGDELKIIKPDNKYGKDIIITIEFNGNITDAMHGLYSSYYQHEGKTKKIYATQFESHHAREMFPCVDEPEAKATFDVTLTTRPGVTTLSNQPIKWQREENGRQVTSFETTPIMSTYLLAIVTGELISKSGATKDGVQVSVYASPAQQVSDLDFAVKNSVKMIEFYNDYFDTPYPLAKSDQVALPDFSSGAMENWGLITYREALLLVNEQSDIQAKQNAAKVIAHELSHQWFGNLVTMKWWDDLWLNESFANMIEYLAVDNLHPHWDIWLDYSGTEVPYALSRDSLDGVQSVRTGVNHPDEISSLFDGAIVYAKGGHLLYMVRNVLGEADFREGLKQYFDKYAYQNTVGDNLWDELSASSDKDIKSLMNTWINQSGFPVVHAELDGDSIKLTQEQFFIGEHEKSNQLWPIPLDSTYNSAPGIMEKKTITIPKEDKLFLLNKNNASHFITHYSKELYQDILKAIKDNGVSANFKIQFLNELMLLAQTDIIDYSELIDAIESFKHEENKEVWNAIAAVLVSLRKFVADNNEVENALKKLTFDVVRKEYQSLGFEAKPNENEADSELRGTILALALYSDDKEAIQYSIGLAKNKSINEIDPELRPVILGAAIKHAKNDKLFNKLLALYPITVDPALKLDILSALCETKDATQIKVILSKMTDKSFMRPQDLVYWFVRLLRNKHSSEQTWEWMINNWKWLKKTFDGDKSFDDYPRYTASVLYSQEHLKNYRNFFEPMINEPALTRTIKLGLTSLEAKVKLIQENKAEIARRLLSNK